MVAPFRFVVSFSFVLVHVESVCARVACHIEVLRMPLVKAIRLQLQGHHMEAVIVREPTVRVFKDPGGIGWIGVAQMGRKGVFSASQGPGMYMMDIEDTVLTTEIVDHCIEVRILWCSLHEDVNGFANDSDRGPKQHDAKRGTEDRVDLEKAGELTHKGRHDDQQATDEGLDDMPERATRV